MVMGGVYFKWLGLEVLIPPPPPPPIFISLAVAVKREGREKVGMTAPGVVVSPPTPTPPHNSDSAPASAERAT